MKGVIFDLDGVLVSTDELHYQAWKKLADELGITEFNREDNMRQRGVSPQHKAGVGDCVVLRIRRCIRPHRAGIPPVVGDAVQPGGVLHIVDTADVLLLHGDGQPVHRVLKLRYFAFGASQPLFQYAMVV